MGEAEFEDDVPALDIAEVAQPSRNASKFSVASFSAGVKTPTRGIFAVACWADGRSGARSRAAAPAMTL